MRFDFRKIYVQRAIYDDFLWRENAENISRRFPNAQIIEVESHWQIPQLFDADASDWMRTKRETLVLGIKSGLTHQKNGRSADFIAASNSNGCLSSCQYCYVARRKGGSNSTDHFYQHRRNRRFDTQTSTKIRQKNSAESMRLEVLDIRHRLQR